MDGAHNGELVGAAVFAGGTACGRGPASAGGFAHAAAREGWDGGEVVV